MKTFISLLTVFVLLLSGCRNKDNAKSSSNNTIQISLDDVQPVNLKEIFSSIEITSLELQDESIIGRLFRGKSCIVVPNQYYIVIDKQYNIFLFDTQGNFKASSQSCIGDGPNCYLILQDVIFNPHTNTIDVLDARGVIYQYDLNFQFLNKWVLQQEYSFRYLYALDNDSYALFHDIDQGNFSIYNKTKQTVDHQIKYPGFITKMTANNTPFHFENDQLYFSPIEMNNNLFTFSPQSQEMKVLFTIDNGQNCLTRKDIESFGDNPKEIAIYLNTQCDKYFPIRRIFNGKHLISTYLKQQKQFINICDLKTGKNTTYLKSPDQKENLPTFFQIEDDVFYAILFPYDLSSFINTDLVINKNVLQQIKEEDNPVIIKYQLKK